MIRAIQTSGPRMGRQYNQRGIGLVEVMVSVLVLAVGLLGVAAMQAVALKGGQGSLESSQAVIQTTSLIELMRANPGGSYNTTRTCSTSSGTGLVIDWLKDFKKTVGVSNDSTTCATIAGCPDACVITVEWDDSRAGGSSTPRIVETRAVL